MRIKEKPTKQRAYSSTVFEKTDKGSYVLRLPTGHKLRFKDIYHRDLCIEGMNNQLFKNAGDMVTYARACPNGYTAFSERANNYRSSAWQE